MRNIRGFHQLRLHYHVYGLQLSANVEIPGLGSERAEKCVADIEINMGFFPENIKRFVDAPSSEYYIEPYQENLNPPHLIVNVIANGKYFHFNYGYGVEFVCNQCATIVWGIWKTTLTLADAALYLLGPIIGFMLRLRGITCLHASGVVIDGMAFAFTGPSGAGKSTLAASFAAKGYPVLTDDVLPLKNVNGLIHTQSGYSRLRLFPNSFKNLQELPDNLPLLLPDWDKCYLDLRSDDYQLYESPAELKVIYIFDWSVNQNDAPSIVELSGAAILPLLAANTYRNELLTPEIRMSEFIFLGQIISNVKVKKIHPVDDISTVPQLREMLLEDFQKETAHKGCHADVCDADLR